MNLSPEYAKIQEEIEKHARDYGLDFYETIFEMVDYDQMNEIAAYGGFPTRYPHWRFGMEYEKLSKSYAYGLSKIYEMVINNNPCYAYLLEANELVDQKIVMAHVYGHCDFFKNNQWFNHTNRKMMDTMANHSTRIRRHIDRIGYDIVEEFIDRCLSLENLIDRHSPFIKRHKESDPAEAEKHVRLLKTDRSYMDSYINPDEFVKSQQEKINTERKAQQNFPAKPEQDVLLFLMNYGPLQPWQKDVLSIIRDEAYYYSPQGMTKIMNEGWASYWHSKIMTQKALKDSEVVDYADHHSGTVAMSQGRLNPYKLGIELYKHIEDRWNKGKFGKEYDECDDYITKKNWNKDLGLGREKIFEVRRNYNDVTFIDAFLTEEFCVENKMFVYQFNRRTGQYEINTRDFPEIKKKLLFQLTNWGQPIIHVVDGNYENRGELLLVHLHEGVDLQPNYTSETMKSLFVIWGRPVALKTVMEGQGKIYRFDGTEFSEKNTDSPVAAQNPQPQEAADI
ncbi:MAG: SpoVR family protein [Oligoflexia bacterium]|nr:SpoVR family protein [Oligoflexia bacterium]